MLLMENFLGGEPGVGVTPGKLTVGPLSGYRDRKLGGSSKNLLLKTIFKQKHKMNRVRIRCGLTPRTTISPKELRQTVLLPSTDLQCWCWGRTHRSAQNQILGLVKGNNPLKS